jgi:hypothetical protein
MADVKNINLPSSAPSWFAYDTVKVKVNLSKNHAIKAYWGVEVWLHSFFDLGTRWR